jgi:hypothetical protein
MLEEPGLLEDLGLAEQVERRTKKSKRIIQDVLNKETRKNMNRALSQRKKGKIIKKTIKKNVGKSGDVSSLKLHERQPGDMSWTDQRKVYREGLRHIGERMWNLLNKTTLWRIIESPGTQKQPLRAIRNGVMMLPLPTNQRSKAVIVETVTHYLDTFGLNGKASVISRNKSLSTNTVFRPDEKTQILHVRSGDMNSGKVINPKIKVKADATAQTVKGGSNNKSTWASTAHAAMAEGAEEKLALLWDTNPDQIAFMMDYLTGHFV